MAKRDIILAEIEKGGATRESLMAAADVNDKGLSSQLTYLRWMGKCPMKQEDGTFKIVSAEEWEAHKAASGTGFGAAKTPAERLTAATKRVGRASSALDNCKKRLDANPDDKLNQLNFEKAKLELQISEILESRAQAEVDALPDEEPVASDDEATEGSDNEGQTEETGQPEEEGEFL